MVKSLDVSVVEDNDIRKVCREGLQGWKQLEDSEIRISQLPGGITNVMWSAEASVDGVKPARVAVRVFGSGASVDRATENSIYRKLSELKVAPEFLVDFGNGRVEMFLPGRTLTRTDIHEQIISERIAEELARLHLVDLRGEDEVPEPTVWSLLDEWLKESLKIIPEIPSFPFDKKQLETSLRDAKQMATQKYANSQVVFCHNDLLAANILWDSDKQQIHFIDFEYGSFNPRGLDLGNHLAEWMGGTEDSIVHLASYPNANQRYQFCQAYLRTLLSVEPDDDQVAELVDEVNFYSLVSHLHWGLWGLCQSVSSTLEFDYALFGTNRLRAYFKYAEEFLK
ncbi:hypothetical protein NDN08_004973 [Rhodosorus marinus]|uniref:Aminoglycoside phosphotransferase domain-containing protein n=1 Tax=Rhodosorus marinus TaxID=101924 RepID=A0AAV8UF69_9RHOD|nr:hypothetical protein NDN08_004973 [Rhodosorus marinus]